MQSNGLAEKTVQTAKRMLEKAKRDRRDPYLALLEQRNTPVASYKSPAQLSMGRHLRSLLPCTTNHLIPETVCYRETQSMFQKKQAEQKSNYDKSAVPLQPLKTGEAVRVKQECEWRPGKVIEIADTPRSYLVETPERAVYRRNRRHLHRGMISLFYTQIRERTYSQSNPKLRNINSSQEAQNTSKQAMIVQRVIVHVRDDWLNNQIGINRDILKQCRKILGTL